MSRRSTLLVCLLYAALVVSSARATDAPVFFRGNIAPATCNVSAGSIAQTLTFSDISVVQMEGLAAGERIPGADVRPYAFTFSECYGVVNASVTLTYTAAGNTPYLPGTGEGRGVSFILTGERCAVTTTRPEDHGLRSGDTLSAAVVDNAASIEGCALMVRNTDAVAPGHLSSQVNVTFSYD
jgi:type 1 fimbria pilin